MKGDLTVGAEFAVDLIPGAGHLSRYVASHPGQLSWPSLRG